MQYLLSLTKGRKLHGKTTFQGLPISIETGAGATRHWKNKETGETGATKMLHPYGYIRGTLGTDGDHVDAFVGPKKDAAFAFVVTQMAYPEFTEVDEFKCMLGFASAKAAKHAYLAHYNDARFFGAMKAMPMPVFKKWVVSSRPQRAELLKSFADSRPRDTEVPGKASSVKSTSEYSRGLRFVLSKATLSKAGEERPGHKYIKRWKGKDGGWEYEYGAAKAPAHKMLVTRETTKDYRRHLSKLLKEYVTLEIPDPEARFREKFGSGSDPARWAEIDAKHDAINEAFTAKANALEDRFRAFSLHIEHVVDRIVPGMQTAERWRAAPTLFSAAQKQRQLDLFPRIWDGKPTEKTGYIVDTSTLRNDREKTADRKKRAVYEALKKIDEYVAAKGVVEAGVREKFVHRGVQIAVTSHSAGIREDRNDDYREDKTSAFHNFISNLDTLKDKLDRRGMGPLLGGSLVVKLADVGRGESLLTQGMYWPKRDVLAIYTLGMNSSPAANSTDRGLYSTMVHELGHRLYFRNMPSRAREAWEDAFNEKRSVLTHDDVDAAMDIWDAAQEKAKAGGGVYAVLRQAGYDTDRASRESETDPEKRRILTVLGKLNVFAHETDGAKLRTDLHNRLDGARDEDNEPWAVFDESLSDYGETSAVEAFAEAFRLYVDNGPGALAPGWRAALESAAEAGGMPLKKSEPAFTLTKSRLSKAGVPAGGWGPIPNGKHGGYRRRKGAGWEYLYPKIEGEKQAKFLDRVEPGNGHEVRLRHDDLAWVLKNGTYGLVSAGKNPKLEPEMSEADQKARHEQLRARLKRGGYLFSEVAGHYGGKEDSFLVMAHNVNRNDLKALGKALNQDSVIFADHGKQEMHFTTGEHEGQYLAGEGYDEVPDASDYYTEMKHPPPPPGSATKFTLHFDWDTFRKALRSLFMKAEGLERPGHKYLKRWKGKNGWEYEYAAPKSGWTPGVTKPPEPDYTPGKSQERIAPFAQSTAEPGTALADIEGGKFMRHVVTTLHNDASGKSLQRKTLHTAVDNKTKLKLIAEFQGLIVNQARDAQRKFGIKPEWETSAGQRSKDTVLEDLRMSALEGFLTAIDKYPGGMSFAKHAQFLVRDFARMHAAKLFSGDVSMPERTTKLMHSYMAARSQAAKHLSVDEPTPEQVVPFWRVKKRDVHNISADSAEGGEMPLKSYKLGADTKEQPGKLEWANRIDGFLAGRGHAVDLLEGPDAALPGVEVGHGLSDTDKADIRQSITRSIADLKSHEISVDSEGRKSTYRADTGSILKRLLGLTPSGEGESTQAIAESVTIERKVGDSWKKLGDRQKLRVMGAFIQEGLAHARKNLGEDASRVVEQAANLLSTPQAVVPGPSYRQVLESRTRGVTDKDAREWRVFARDRYRGNAQALRHINSMGDKEVKKRVAQERMMAKPLTPEMRRQMTRVQAVEPTDESKEYGSTSAVLTDPSTGKQREVRVRTIGSLKPRPAGSVVKSVYSEAEMAMLFANHPNLMRLYFADTSLSDERRVLDRLMGIHG